MVIFHSFLYVYQRVNLHFPMVFLWFSYDFPIVLWFSYCFPIIFHDAPMIPNPAVHLLDHRWKAGHSADDLAQKGHRDQDEVENEPGISKAAPR